MQIFPEPSGSDTPSLREPEAAARSAGGGMGLSAGEAGELAEPAPGSQWSPASVLGRVPGQASSPRPRSPQSLRRTGSCSPRYTIRVSPSHGKDRLRAGSTLSVEIGV